MNTRKFKSTVFLFFFVLTGAFSQTFTLKSNSLSGQATHEMFLNGFGCEGDNMSPQLSWENPPAATKSFAITIHDQDAPTDSGFWHWVVFDIPIIIGELDKNASGKLSGISEDIIESNTDFGAPGYGGPCPPQGDGAHRYIITVYALKVEKLGLNKDTTPAIVSFYLNNTTIEKASLVFYAKQ